MTDQERAVTLWGLLDDISTLSDMTKGNYEAFHDQAYRIAEKRHRIYQSNGYDLFLPDGGRVTNDCPAIDAAGVWAGQVTHVDTLKTESEHDGEEA